MKLSAWQISRMPYGLSLAFAVGMAFLVINKPPRAAQRSTWRPTPAMRAEADLAPVRVLARLREVRTRLNLMADAGEGDPEDFARVDQLLFDLICDYDLATTPMEGEKP